MSHDIFTVEFHDGSRMYGINDGTSCYMYRFLFNTLKDAQTWLSSGDRDIRILPKESDNAGLTEEDVIMYPDDSWAFSSRASRLAAWITGPNRDVSQDETKEDHPIYGQD